MGIFRRKPRDYEMGEDDMRFRKTIPTREIGYPKGKSPDRWKSVALSGEETAKSGEK